MGPQKRNVEEKQNIFDFSGLWKHAKCGPKQAREFFPANPNLADILGMMDFDLDHVHFLDLVDSRFPGFTNLDS